HSHPARGRERISYPVSGPLPADPVQRVDLDHRRVGWRDPVLHSDWPRILRQTGVQIPMKRKRRTWSAGLGLLIIAANLASPGQAAAPTAARGAAIRLTPGPYDVVILGGRVVDGTGNAWFSGDVALQGDRIARVAPAGLLRDAAAKERIDAKGLVVCPGFIDTRRHARHALLRGAGRLISHVTQ